MITIEIYIKLGTQFYKMGIKPWCLRSFYRRVLVSLNFKRSHKIVDPQIIFGVTYLGAIFRLAHT